MVNAHIIGNVQFIKLLGVSIVTQSIALKYKHSQYFIWPINIVCSMVKLLNQYWLIWTWEAPFEIYVGLNKHPYSSQKELDRKSLFNSLDQRLKYFHDNYYSKHSSQKYTSHDKFYRRQWRVFPTLNCAFLLQWYIFSMTNTVQFLL